MSLHSAEVQSFFMQQKMENIQSYYMVIPAPIWSAEITAKAMILYGHVSVLAKKEGYCFADNKYFEKVMKISTSTVQRCFQELESKNLISRELIYKENSKEVETRKIYIFEHTPIIKNEHRPIPKTEHGSILKTDQDNNTRINNTRSNLTQQKLSEKNWKFVEENWTTTEAFTHNLKEDWFKIPLSEQQLIVDLIKLNPGFFKPTKFWKRNFLKDAGGNYQWLYNKVETEAAKQASVDFNNISLDELYKDL